MSWLSNLTGNRPPVMPPPPNDDSLDKLNSTGKNSTTSSGAPTKQVPSVSQWSNFDPTGLERAAHAAKDLEKSKHARDALDLARIQETTKQEEFKTKLKEREAYMEQLQLEKVRVDHEEKRRTLEAETHQYKQRANYQDQLSRKRQDDQLAKQQKMNDQTLARQEESVKKQEAMRKATIDYKSKLKRDNDMAVVKAKVQAQGKMRRENRDIELETIHTKLSEYRTTILDIVKTSSDIIGTGFSSFINNPYQVSMLCGAVLGMSLGLKSIKASVQLVSSYVESRLGKPSLIRETSRFNRRDLPMQFFRRYLAKDNKAEEKVMRGIFLDKQIEEQLIRISISTVNTKHNNGYYRNLLFYGPPGTGKTLFAKSMAHTVGMDYAIMTGGDVAPLGKDAVTSIHNVFKWASTSKKGLLLFIDEADAFLKKRNKEAISEDVRNALNAFLYNTGEASKNFMLVLATNQPSQLDRAVNDRVDELVGFTLPKETERRRLLKYYFNKYIHEEKSIKIEPTILDNIDSHLDQINEITSGLSGREISKLAISWQASAFASNDGVVTAKMLYDRATELASQHQLKIDWEKSPGTIDMTAGSTIDYLGHQQQH